MNNQNQTNFSFTAKVVNSRLSVKEETTGDGWVFDAPGTYLEWAHMFNAQYSRHSVKACRLSWEIECDFSWNDRLNKIVIQSRQDPSTTNWILEDDAFLGWQLLKKKAAVWDYEKKSIYYSWITLPDFRLALSFTILEKTGLLNEDLLTKLKTYLYPEWANDYFLPEDSKKYAGIILQRFLAFLVGNNYIVSTFIQNEKGLNLDLDTGNLQLLSTKTRDLIKEDFLGFIHQNIVLSVFQSVSNNEILNFFNSLPPNVEKWVGKRLRT